MTGNPSRMDPLLAARAPPNVRFTGFLPDPDYWALLRSADAIIDLTLMEDCLVSGAYEALAVGTPMLLSNNRASVELFAGAAAFTDNTTADIRRGLERLRLGRDEMKIAAAVKARRTDRALDCECTGSCAYDEHGSDTRAPRPSLTDGPHRPIRADSCISGIERKGNRMWMHAAAHVVCPRCKAALAARAIAADGQVDELSLTRFWPRRPRGGALDRERAIVLRGLPLLLSDPSRRADPAALQDRLGARPPAPRGPRRFARV